VRRVAGNTRGCGDRSQRARSVLGCRLHAWLRLGFGLLLAVFLSTGLRVIASRADPTVPPLDGRVVDKAHVLDRLSVERITADLRAFEQRSGVQIAIITLPDLQGYPIEDWGLTLLRGWHIGQQGKNNGVVVVIAPNDHKVRIETGYGSEGPLPDATASLIIRRDMVPAFKQGDYAGGLQSGLRSIETALAADFVSAETASAPTPSVNHSSIDGRTIFIIICIPFAFMALAILLAVVFRGSGQRVWSSSNGTRYRDNDPFWNDRSRYDNSNDSSSGFGFSFGSSSSDNSSSSSDSFSGGGGSGGGGGASGSW